MCSGNTYIASGNVCTNCVSSCVAGFFYQANCNQLRVVLCDLRQRLLGLFLFSVHDLQRLLQRSQLRVLVPCQ